MVISEKAHGRVNLIGEHTDYNEGFVLPTSLPQATHVTLETRDDDEVTLRSRNFPDESFHFRLGEEKVARSWADYIQGMTWLLHKEGSVLRGFNLSLHSEIPMGSGLSSSAALEVAVLKALDQAFHLDLSAIEIAKLGQRVENEFVGARVGIMDQMAASLGKWGEALFIDTRSLEFERIPIPVDEIDLLVIHSGLAHQHAGGDYNRRRAECEEVCQKLQVKSLRELGINDLPRLQSLPETLQRRAKHVITENQRVIQAVDCLKRKNFRRMGELMKESHLSMRDDYAVSIPEIDILVEIANAEKGAWGARLTGGGFGGSIVALTEKDRAVEIGDRVLEHYWQKTRVQGSRLVPS